ncbi:hypothetical protein JM16_005738 [Phytophthora kernoviae]|uniref:3'-5' exonuclease domain-containing protein n=1 Tax=Phytophthora kernoviae TaxID=325452 RepID=A0A8T0LV78_9STRA|nr:hypothetical protein JM16_005738 [Phytophthora kernoviae]
MGVSPSDEVETAAESVSVSVSLHVDDAPFTMSIWLHEAVEALRQWDSAKVQMEITLAFSCVSRAPSFFLQCVDLYGKLPEKQLTNIIQWIETAVACIKLSQDPKISQEDSSLAGAMLPAFQRSRMPFVADFALAYRVEMETLRALCAHLFKIKVGLAVHFMDCLKMKHLLPAPMVLEAAIKYKDFRAGDVLAKGDRNTQQEFVQMLIDRNVQDKVIKKRLSLFKLQASEFPIYFERRQKATLRFLVHSSEFKQALEFVEGSEGLKFYACKMIIRHAGPKDPATKQFVFRSGLAQNFPEIDTSEEADKSFDDKEDLAPLDSCLSIVDVIGEANVIFVDTPVALEACVDYLKTQPVIGFDSEWKAVHTSTGPEDLPAQCALLQLASREKAFVVDVITLYDNGNILAPIFLSPSILKLGFDTRGDVKALRLFLTGGYATEHIMSMLVDLQTVTRKLSTPGTTQSLKADGDKISAEGLAMNIEVAGSGGSTTVDQEKNGEVPGPMAKPRKWKKKRSKTSKCDGDTKGSRLGLTAVAEDYLGLPLDKRPRMSDWERRPLTQAQLHYAALDAHVLVQIYYKMQEQHPVDTFEAVLR